MDSQMLAYLGELSGMLEPPQQVGVTPHGMRMILILRSGRFDGPDLHGELLPGGGDWAILRGDGVGDLDIRATLRTDDGELIYMNSRGIMVFSQEALGRWGEGQAVDPSETYFRTAPFFETGSEKYAWLNRIMTVGFGELTAGGGVCYKVYKVL